MKRTAVPADVVADLTHQLELCRLELERTCEELRLREREFSDGRARYAELLDFAPFAYVTLDVEGKILEANPAAATMLGERRERLTGRRFEEFVCQQSRESFASFRMGLSGKNIITACEVTICCVAKERSIPVRLQGLAPKVPATSQVFARVAMLDLSEITTVHRALERQEVELRRTEDRLASFMRATNDCVLVLCLNGFIKDVNPATLSLLKRTKEQVVGLHIDDLDSGSAAPIGRHIQSMEVVWEDSRGSAHTLLLSVSPLRNSRTGALEEVLCVAQDITERKESEQRLRESETLLRQVAETIEDGFYVREAPSGTLAYMNPSYGEILDCMPEQLVAGQACTLTVAHPDDVGELASAYKRFIKGDPLDEEYRIVRKDAGIRWIRERAFLVADDEGGVERIVGILQDITEQRQMDQELRQGQKMEAIGQLASGVAHDFNNLLMGIHGCASIAVSKVRETSEVQPFLQAILKSSENGTTITKQLLTFAARRDLEIQNFDINQLIVANETMLTRLLGDEVVLHTILSDEECEVRMDPGQMEQVLMNLGINARDAMVGGGELYLMTKHVPDLDLGPGFVELRVRDTGPGMSEATRERIFEPFFTTKNVGQGTGLGLSTVYGIVHKAGGTIRCESSAGEGTTFVVTLPAVLSTLEGDAPTPEELAQVPPRGDRTILVVEDDETVRLATRLYLESGGYRVLEAGTGAEAMELIGGQQDKPSLLLTDVAMPGMNGVCLAGKAREIVADIRVIFMSAHPASWLTDRHNLDAEEITLQKPFSRDELLACIEESFEVWWGRDSN